MDGGIYKIPVKLSDFEIFPIHYLKLIKLIINNNAFLHVMSKNMKLIVKNDVNFE